MQIAFDVRVIWIWYWKSRWTTHGWWI